MAAKSHQEALSTKQIEELLDAVDMSLDRLKTLYEQYFLGIQKQAPGFIHNDVERKLRDLTQLNIRNTRLRYRLATLQQKYGSYNSYWRRTLRQIENGTYIRNLAKIGREAIKTGSEIPEEILAAMPKRMREQVLRDRDAAIAIAKRRKQLDDGPDDGLSDADLLTLADEELLSLDVPVAEKPLPARPLQKKTATGAHVLSEDDGDIDFNALFSAFDDDAPKSFERTQADRPLPKAQVPPEAVRTSVLPRMSDGVPEPHIATQATGPVPAPSRTTHTGAIPPLVIAASTAMPRTPTDASNRSRAAPTPTPTDVQPYSSGVPRPIGPQPSHSHLVARPTPQNQSAAVPRPIGAQPSQPHQVERPTHTQSAATPRATAAPPSHPRQAARDTLVGSPSVAPSQAARPNPIAPGSAAQTGPIAVESMSGPFPRVPSEKSAQPATGAAPGARSTQRLPRLQPSAPLKPPPGMTEADVNALHAKYVKAKEMVGEKVDPGSREKLLKTITQTAPKIMEQYKASSVDFSVVVKDNQVVIKAKPKTDPKR